MEQKFKVGDIITDGKRTGEILEIHIPPKNTAICKSDKIFGNFILYLPDCILVEK